MFGGGKTVYKKEDFPKEPHLAIITFDSVTYDYDPGDRGCTTHFSVYEWWPLDKRDRWEAKILDLMAPKYGSPKGFIVLDQGKLVEPKLQVKLDLRG